MSPAFAEAAERLVALEAAGRVRSPEHGTAVAKKLHERLAQQLSPIIGDTGFAALFARAVKEIKPDFPCLHELDTAGVTGDLAAQLRERVAKQDPATIEAILVALIGTFTGLLSTFIGEGLTSTLLHNAWPEALPNEPPSGEER